MLVHLYALWSIRGDFINGFVRVSIRSLHSIEGTDAAPVSKNFIKWDNTFICDSQMIYMLRNAEHLSQGVGMTVLYLIGSVVIGQGASIGFILFWGEKRVDKTRSGVSDESCVTGCFS